MITIIMMIEGEELTLDPPGNYIFTSYDLFKIFTVVEQLTGLIKT